MNFLSLIRSWRSMVVLLSLLFFLVEVWQPSTAFVRAGAKEKGMNAPVECVNVSLKKADKPPPQTPSYVRAQAFDGAIHNVMGESVAHSSVGLSLFEFHPKETGAKHFVVDLISNPSGFRPSLKQPPISSLV